ncbi:MAG: transposase [Patescibacteria group bacterium]
MRKFKFSTGEYYHVYNRGVDRRIIFSNEHDHDRFMKLLFISNGTNSFDINAEKIEDVYEWNRGEQLVDVCAYSLLTNHFHLLLKEIREGGISKFMQKLLTAYTMYFNAMNERSGSLFQGTYRAKHMNTDNYFKHIPTYIHLNHLDIFEPNWKINGVKDKEAAKRFLINYKYSSLYDYLGDERIENRILSQNSLLDIYDSATELLDNIHDWMEIAPELNALTK